MSFSYPSEEYVSPCAIVFALMQSAHLIQLQSQAQKLFHYNLGAVLLKSQNGPVPANCVSHDSKPFKKIFQPYSCREARRKTPRPMPDPVFNALFRHCFCILSDFHFGNTRNPLIFSSFRASKPT